MDSIVDQFTDFAHAIRYENIRPASLHAAKRSLLDTLGCAIGSYASAPIVALRKIASRVQCDASATLIGTNIATSPEMAAFVNGSMTRYSDFNDDYFGTEGTTARGDTGPHPSDSIGAILATAEATGANGEATLLAIVLAYEVAGQMVDEVVLRAKGWDHAILHAMASALACGKLMGLNREQLSNALCLAVVPNIALFETRMGELSHWKGLAGPNGARNGLFAALMAAEGITGPAKAFEGPRGFMQQLGVKFSLGKFSGRDDAFRVEHTYFKSLPIRYELQVAVTLALNIHAGIASDQIDRLVVYMGRKSIYTRLEDPSLWAPLSRETADHSAPYLIGAALVDGVIDHDTFTERRFRDPDVLAVVDRIEMVADPKLEDSFPWKMGCCFELDSAKFSLSFTRFFGQPQY